MPLINVFLITSTYLAVLTAVIRFFAVAFPFRSRNNSCLKHSGFASLLVYCVVLILTAPQFVFYKIVIVKNITNNTTHGAVIYSLKARFELQSTAIIASYINRIYPVLSSFLPCLILIIFNIGLIYQLHRAKMARRYVCVGQQITSTSAASRGCSCRLTVTLILMFTAHIVFVAPSDVIKYFSFYDLGNHLGGIIACVLNLSQASIFALNFVLFISLNSSFRNTFCQMIVHLFRCKKTRHSSPLIGRHVNADVIELNDCERAPNANANHCLLSYRATRLLTAGYI